MLDAGTGGVILLGDLPCEGKKAVNLSASLKIPGFIERTPAYDGGMVEISFNRLDPFRDKCLIAGIGGMIKAPVCHFAPGQITQPVAVIEEAGFKYLLVQPGSVEACRHGKADIIYQSLIGGRRINAVGIESLIQDQTLEYGLAVNQEAVAVQLHFTEAEVAAHLVIAEGKLQIIKASCPCFPEMDFAQGDGDDYVAGIRPGGCASAGGSLIRSGGAEDAFPFHYCLDGYGAFRYIRIILDAADMCGRREFHPYGLPDTCRSGIGAVM